MFTRVINILGLDLGESSHLMGAAYDNKKGFFENIFFLNINIEILNSIYTACSLMKNGHLSVIAA